MYACLNIKWEWIVVDVRRKHSEKGESCRTGSKRDDGNILFMVTQPHCFIVVQERAWEKAVQYIIFSLLSLTRSTTTKEQRHNPLFLNGYNLLLPSLCRIMHKKRNYVLIICGNRVFIFLLSLGLRLVKWWIWCEVIYYDDLCFSVCEWNAG